MKHATSIALHDYWQSCRGRTGGAGGGINAIELAPLLPALFLIDLDIAAGCRFRFCGATLASRYGRDLTDESFLALWNTEDAAAMRRDLRVISTGAAGIVTGVLGETVGSGFTTFEMLLLPISGETGDAGVGIAGVIGSMARIGGHDETNRVRARLVTQSIRSVRFLPPAERIDSMSQEFDDLIPLTARPAPRSYGHLTVLQGGK